MNINQNHSLPKQNRRNYSRYDIALPIKVDLCFEQGSFYQGKMDNLSRSGMQLHAKDYFSPHTHLLLIISIPDFISYLDKLIINAETNWVQPDKEEYAYGISFTHITNKKIITTIINKLGILTVE